MEIRENLEDAVLGPFFPNGYVIRLGKSQSTDFILFGTLEHDSVEPLELLLKSCSTTERSYAEQLLKTFLLAMNSKKDSSN